MALIAELKRRKVFKVGAAYLVVAWLAVQAASIAFPTFEAPLWVLRVFILIALLGFPIAVVMAWVFDITPEGVKLDANATGSKRLFAVAILLMALAIGWYFYGQPSFRKGDAATPRTTAAAPVPSVDPHSIAVLPFVNMSADPTQEFFSDGIAEELLNRLAQFPDLKVAARTSAFQFKGKNLDITDIGRRLKVSHVLEGSVRKQGTRLRITAQLIDSTSGFHLWSETYERDASDVFKVQDEIATAIATALEAKLSGRAVSATAAKVADPAAYDDYLQGRAYFARRTGDNLQHAVEAFDRAIAREPSYSPAHSGRAFALVVSTTWVPWLPTETAFAQAGASVEEALRLDPDNAEAYLVRGSLRTRMYQEDEGRADLDHAYALAPGSVDVLNFLGDALTNTGDLRGAERMKRQAMALDPLFFVHPGNLADILNTQGRFREALAMGNRAAALGGGEFAQTRVFWAQFRLRELDAARQTSATLCTMVGAERRLCLITIAQLYAASGRTRELAPLLAKLTTTKWVGADRWTSASDLAGLYANDLHDIPKATAVLREALQGTDFYMQRTLLYGPHGARLPEEVSQDPAWLAAWADPKLHETMAAYRKNLLAFRKGN